MSKSDKVLDEKCVGCAMFGDSLECNYRTDDQFDEKFCPCKDCLIKGMCMEACENYCAFLNISPDWISMVDKSPC